MPENTDKSNRKHVSRKKFIFLMTVECLCIFFVIFVMIHITYGHRKKIDAGFEKMSEFYDIQNGNRAYIIYTSTTDVQRMVNYARTHLVKNDSFTYTHFYDSKDDIPDISTVNPEYAFVPPNSRHRIMTFEYMPSGRMVLWDKEMSYYIELDT